MQLMTRSMHELPWILVLSLTLGVESAEKLPILGRTIYVPNIYYTSGKVLKGEITNKLFDTQNA